jgi:hypothetical protein
VPAAANAAWEQTLQELGGLTMEGPAVGPRRPVVLRLTDNGKEAWAGLVDRLRAEMKADFPQSLVGPWSKLQHSGARLALIVHCLRRVQGETQDDDVDGESVQRAGRLVSYFQSQARKVYGTMATEPKEALAQRVLEWLGRHGDIAEFSRRQVHQHLRHGAGLYASRDLDGPLWVLEQHGYIRLQAAERCMGRGRRPGARYEVNPTWRADRMLQENGIMRTNN